MRGRDRRRVGGLLLRSSRGRRLGGFVGVVFVAFSLCVFIVGEVKFEEMERSEVEEMKNEPWKGVDVFPDSV